MFISLSDIFLASRYLIFAREVGLSKREKFDAINQAPSSIKTQLGKFFKAFQITW